MLFDLVAAGGNRMDGDDIQLALAQATASLFLADDHRSLSAACDEVQTLLRAAHNVSASVYACTVFLLGWTELRLRRDPVRAVDLLRVAVRECMSTGQHWLARRASANLAFALAFSGDLNGSATSVDAHSVEQWNHWHNYDGGIEVFTEGFIDFWRNDLAAADEKFAKIIESDGGTASYAALARIYRALIACARGNEAALSHAENGLQRVSAVEAHGVPWAVYVLMARAKLADARGDTDSAASLCADIPTSRYIPVVSIFVAEMCRRHGDFGRATEILDGLDPEIMPSFVHVCALLTRSLIHRSRGERSPAHEHLEHSLMIASEHSILRPFGDPDPDIDDFLVEHAQQGSIFQEFIGKTLSMRKGIHSLTPSALVRLSRRESEVLGYLRTSMTTAEIARALYVSVNTVKSQKQSIYRKLGVSSRSEATAPRTGPTTTMDARRPR